MARTPAPAAEYLEAAPVYGAIGEVEAEVVGAPVPVG